MLEKMTPTMFAIPYNEQFEETIRTVAAGVVPRKGNDYAEWGTVCAFMADLIPTIFNEALGQIVRILVYLPSFETFEADGRGGKMRRTQLCLAHLMNRRTSSPTEIPVSVHSRLPT